MFTIPIFKTECTRAEPFHTQPARWHRQRGAMFGMDARISLAIFGALSIIGGAYSVLNINSIYASSFAGELDDTTAAIESIHQDLEEDLHASLENITDQNAYVALYDNIVLKPGRLRGKWLGPYLNTDTAVHPRYGEIRLVKRKQEVDQECVLGDICYLWLTYNTVPTDVAESLNQTFDGREEIAGDISGRIQWRASGNNDKANILWFRATRALRANNQLRY